MARALLIVLDSFGIGHAPDARAFGDEGASTLGHIAAACHAGRGERDGLRSGPLRLPVLETLGLGLAAQTAGSLPAGFAADIKPRGSYGSAIETAPGKDTPSGHWEMAGAGVDFAPGYFPDTQPSFPASLTEAMIREAALPGILGNCHASGTQIIEDFGAEHVRSGKPICYTSVDSVLQIAAHEETFGLQRLYDLCLVARRLCDDLKIGRIIARPFVGTAATGFRRTAHRKDFAMPPPHGHLLDRASAAGRTIVSIGKIGDIFAHRATGQELKGADNEANFDHLLNALQTLPDGGLIFANFVDFDSEYGHRRDVAGYAAALERFDARLPALIAALQPEDLAIITADHGNDPTWRGTDHTREQVPVLAFSPGQPARAIGQRPTFADMAATLARHIGLSAPAFGTPF
ncbi:MAG: phosphopentomutase [Hyphomicrobiales bacterium]|nr:phosphopentomutase [Hyphomicrobiales bacterium]